MALLGAHMSIAGGLSKAIDRGESLRCGAIQIFTQSSRTWAISDLKEEEIKEFKEVRKKAKHLRALLAHNSYLLNLSTANNEVRKKSVAFFLKVMDRCEALGVDGLITHPGSHLGAGIEEGIKQTAKSLETILKTCRGYQTKVILENTAGQGDCIGHQFSELRKIVERTAEPDRIFFCFDTQHAFAAGYDLRTKETYERTFASFEKELGKNRIVAFHLNDALKEFGCRVDRHEHIGKGHLGVEPFRLLLNDRVFASIPMCLETEPGDEMKNYRMDLKTLRSLMRPN